MKFTDFLDVSTRTLNALNEADKELNFENAHKVFKEWLKSKYGIKAKARMKSAGWAFAELSADVLPKTLEEIEAKARELENLTGVHIFIDVQYSDELMKAVNDYVIRVNPRIKDDSKEIYGFSKRVLGSDVYGKTFWKEYKGKTI